MNNKQNTLLTLNNKLFEQLDRIGNADLDGEQLKTELERTDAVVSLSRTIISNADLMLKAAVARDEKLGCYKDALPEPLQVGGK